MTLGTPDYMSPEQASGEEVTHACDIYALGVLVYEMLDGQLPFSADAPLSVLFMHMSDTPPAALHPRARFAGAAWMTCSAARWQNPRASDSAQPANWPPRWGPRCDQKKHHHRHHRRPAVDAGGGVSHLQHPRGAW